MKVKVRKERDYYLVYFIDSRRIVGVNEVGAIVLDLLLNKEKKIQEIAEYISSTYQLSTINVKADVLEFLKQIKQEINPDKFSIVEQEQLISPLGVELEITTACNLRCKHCFQKDYGNNFLETNKAIEIINTLADNNIFEVSLIGGEPFKHHGIMDIIRCCKEREMAITVVTNGTFLNEEIVDQLAQIPRLTLVISLDGTREVHDFIRGNNVFDKVESAIKTSISKGIAVEITCTLNAININKYREVIEYCEGWDIPCNFNLFKPFKKEQESLIPESDVFFRVVVDLLEMRHDKGRKIGISNAAIVAEILGLPPRNECRATLSGLVIDMNGKMVPCPLLVAAGYYKEEELPIFDDNFLKTWRDNKIFDSFRKNGLKECQARSYIFSGNIKGYDPYGITAFFNYKNKNDIDSKTRS